MQKSVSVCTAAILSMMSVAISMSSAGAEQAVQSTNSADVKLKLDYVNDVVLSKDINGMPAKTKLISTPSFHEYSLACVADGIRNRKGLDWKNGSWASEENEEAHGIEIQLAKPQKGGRFQVTWAHDVYNSDHGKWWISRNYVIQVKGKTADAWKTVIAVKNNQSAVGSYPLPEDEAFTFIRIYQPAAGGHADRPNIMWIGQIELTE